MKYFFTLILILNFSFAQYTESLEKAAEQGDPEAQWQLGAAYALGKSVPQDYVKAVEWYQLSAEQGHPYAQWRVGSAYYFGDGVDQSYVKAKEWFIKSCNNGHTEGCKDAAHIEKELLGDH